MATKYWLGSAAQRPDLWKLTITGTWVAGDKMALQTAEVGVTGNRTAVTITLGASGLTNDNVADKVYRAINAVSSEDNLVDDETRTSGCQEVPEWNDLVATYPGTGNVVTITGLPGVHCTFRRYETSDSGAANSTLTEPQVATGKWFWDNAANWSGSTLPVNDDIVYFDSRSKASCMFGLPDESLELETLYINMGFAGRQLGLPVLNRHDYETGRPKPESSWYPEWRQRRPVFDNAGSGSNPEFIVGQGSGAGPRYVNIEQIDLPAKLMVHRTGSPLPHEQHVVNFNTSSVVDGSSVCVYGGSVALAPEAETDTGRIMLLDVGRGASVYVGPSAQFIGTAKLTMNGGFVRCDSHSFGADSTVSVLGGTLELPQGATSTTTFRIFHPGVVFYSGTKAAGTGTVAAVYCSGTISFARAVQPVNWTAVNPIQLMRGARILDPQRKVSWPASNGIDLIGCGLGAVTLQLGQNITITKLANDP